MPITKTHSSRSLKQSYARLYWNMFGYGDPDDVIIKVNVTMEANGSTHSKVRVNHTMTEEISTLIYGFYHLFVVIVLLNMLIAMMANTYNTVVVSMYTYISIYIIPKAG